MNLSKNDYKNIIYYINSTLPTSDSASNKIQILLENLFGLNNSVSWSADKKGNMYNLDFHNFSDRFIIDYVETYSSKDIMNPKKQSLNVINNENTVITINEITTPTKFTKSIYYEFVKKHNMIDQMVMYFSNESFIFGGIGFARFEGEYAFTLREKTILKLLSTHLHEKFNREKFPQEIYTEIIFNKDINTTESNNDFKKLLSKRETELYQFVLKGFTNEQISTELYISINTVKKHLRNMYDKVGVFNRTSLIYKLK